MARNTRDAKRAETAQRILEAAQEEFALHGFEGATIRSIADRAGVHASLVMQHYGSKASLFAIALRLPIDDRVAASEHFAEVLDVRMSELPPEARALVRSMLTVPEAEAFMRTFLEERVDNLKGSLEGDDAELRAALIVSSILGLTIARHFLRLQAFERIPQESLVDAAGAWLSTVSTGSDPDSRAAGEHAKITLRDLEDADLDRLFDWEQDRAAVEMAAFTRADPSDRDAFDAHYDRVRNDPAVILRAVDDGNGLVGTIASFIMDDDREVSYWIAPARWGEGLASAALSAFLSVDTIRPLIARVAEHNLGSATVLTRAGFVEIGSARSYADGLGHDVVEHIYRLDR